MRGGQPVAVKLTLRPVEGLQGPVNKVNAPGFSGSGRAVGREDLRRQSLYFRYVGSTQIVEDRLRGLGRLSVVLRLCNIGKSGSSKVLFMDPSSVPATMEGLKSILGDT